MKVYFLVTLSFLSFTFSINAQNWTENLPDRKVRNNTLNFSDFQKAFYESYPKDVITYGTINQNGTNTKIPGWKLFKRW